MAKWTSDAVLNTLEELEKKSAIKGLKFRKRVLSDTDEAVKEITGKDLPAGLRLNVIEHAPWFDQIRLVPELSPSERLMADIDAVAKKLFS